MSAVVLLAGCSSQSALRPSEVLDESTGMTVEELHRPIELIQSTNNLPTTLGHHISFAYLGPVEWDRSGTASYGLWVHLAPGNDWQFDSIRSPGDVTLVLDDGAVSLETIDPPELGRSPYRAVAAWGQTAYFGADVTLLKRMAASRTLELDLRTDHGEPVRFAASPAAHAALARYVAAQGF